MKPIIFLTFFLSIILGVQQSLNAQGCIQGISTDPDNPIPNLSPTDPLAFHENTFDWREQWFPVPTYYCSNLPSSGVESPFWSLSLNVDGIAFNELSDFQPADGWELVKRGFGYLMREGRMTYATAQPSGGKFVFPYLMLYNKHSGVLRVMVALPFTNSFQQVEISLSLEKGSSLITGFSNLNGLFSQGRNAAVGKPIHRSGCAGAHLQPLLPARRALPRGA